MCGRSMLSDGGSHSTSLLLGSPASIDGRVLVFIYVTQLAIVGTGVRSGSRNQGECPGASAQSRYMYR